MLIGHTNLYCAVEFQIELFSLTARSLKQICHRYNFELPHYTVYLRNPYLLVSTLEVILLIT